ncbi:Uncharacterized protein FKW44_014609 [Caligus rogercresseyi]|uniref:Uncharacterized protein n=1 Tax=Caligus rogercresseyi TaxID=217165 RepID=A0A7T8GZ90_CALRO|nr:Uncharacterized protein FKW44_014609 [Caligus rogercresseyi]
MLGVVTSDRKAMPPYRFPKGLKVGMEEYLEVMKTVVKPWLDSTYPKGQSGEEGCAKPHPSAEAMKATVNEEWANMSVAFISKVCSSFRPRITAMINAGGDHFEI